MYLEQNGLYKIDLWTAGRRVGPEAWVWFYGPDVPYVSIPNNSYLWAPNEPRPYPDYNVAVFAKEEFSYSLITYPRNNMSLKRYMCEVINSDKTADARAVLGLGFY